jgi:hypothetical protein
MVFDSLGEDGQGTSLWIGSAPAESEVPSEPSASQTNPAEPASNSWVGRRSGRGRKWPYVVVVIAVAVLVAGGVYLALGVHHVTGQTGVTILAHSGTYYSLPVGQFNGVTFIINTTAEINGTFVNTYGVTLYTMTPAQFLVLVRTSVVSGYEWTSGRIPDNAIDMLNLTIQPGSWVLVFLNPNTIQTTLVGFYSDLTLETT